MLEREAIPAKLARAPPRMAAVNGMLATRARGLAGAHVLVGKRALNAVLEALQARTLVVNGRACSDGTGLAFVGAEWMNDVLVGACEGPDASCEGFCKSDAGTGTLCRCVAKGMLSDSRSERMRRHVRRS